MKGLKRLRFRAACIATVFILSANYSAAAEKAKGVALIPNTAAAEATPLKGLTAERFRALADNVKIRAGKDVMTKGQVKTILSKARVSRQAKMQAGMAKFMADFESERRASEQKHQASAAAHNSRTLGEFGRFAGSRPRQADVIASDAPLITEVAGEARDGFMLMIKGTGFGSEQGKVQLSGKFLHAPFDLQVVKWSPTALAVKVAMENNGGPDQTAKLVVTRKDGKAGNAYAVPFTTVYDTAILHLTSNDITCSGQAWENECGGGPETMKSTHIAMPTGLTYSGRDTGETILKNGWVYYHADCLPENTSVSFEGGKYTTAGSLEPNKMTITFNWTIATQEISNITAEDLDRFSSSCACAVKIRGPKGLLWH